MNQGSSPSELPPDLLWAISTQGGGKVVLVLGAGCSNEEPTCLPLSGELSARCLRKLVQDGILEIGDVDDPRDLSSVAEAVFQKTGSQRALVERFPPGEFKQAEPNEGYRIMAALLIEGAIADVLTLNFDLAARSALTSLGASPNVSTIRGPEEHSQLAERNLIHLHRDIDSPPDEIILRKSKLEKAWENGWEQIVTQRVLSGPTTVFVGLGSPASVLVATMNRIRETLDDTQTTVYFVDPSADQDSHLADGLRLAPRDSLRMGWGEFMRSLSQRVVREQCAAVEDGCSVVANQLGIQPEDVSDTCNKLAAVGLLGLGQIRAAWMLKSGSYLPHAGGGSIELMSDLVLAIRLLERVSVRQVRFCRDGIVEFFVGNNISQVMVCSGGGLMNYARVTAELSVRRETLQRDGRFPSDALVAGVRSSPGVSTPNNITVNTDPNDIISGPLQLRIIDIDNLRDDPKNIFEVTL